MNKIFSILLCCLCLGTSQTALFGNDHEPRPAVQQSFSSLPPTQPNSPAQQTRILSIPGIPTDRQPTNRQATQARTNAGAAQLRNEYAAQMAPRGFSAAPVNTEISDDMFSESELSSEDERPQTPLQTRTIARQNNLPDSFYTQVHRNPRSFVGEARERHLNRSPLVQITVITRRDSQSPRILVFSLTHQEFIARLQAACRARQERNNRHYNYYGAQD